MVDFLTRKNTAFQVEEIVKKAEKELILISPYLQLSEDLVARLKDRDKHPVDITIIYKDDKELKPNQKQRLEHEIQKLQQLKHLSLARLKHLHAKCYYNEDCMVITSMNLYDYSERNNWEMGLLIRRNEDEKVFTEVRNEAESIIRESTPVKSRESWANKAVKLGRLVGDLLTEEEPKRPKSSTYSSKPRTRQTGYCIRCKKHIPLDVEQPLCHDCWEKWNIHKNPSYKEKYCHICGKRASTSMARPQCNSCYHK